MMREITRYQVEDDEGNTYKIIEYQEFLDARSMSNPNAPPIPGMKVIRTIDGMHVNFIDEETREIVELALIVRKKT